MGADQVVDRPLAVDVPTPGRTGAAQLRGRHHGLGCATVPEAVDQRCAMTGANVPTTDRMAVRIGLGAFIPPRPRPCHAAATAATV
jgi:hypothetical protein